MCYEQYGYVGGTNIRLDSKEGKALKAKQVAPAKAAKLRDSKGHFVRASAVLVA
jgi:hypothetical protein